ncbi:hypothetical protein C8A01DRAFT_36521 [Parachaetomium inaequale]|uniref:Uncharacterized protein n=1 Tax=Parachaetomium inaequale TaxID=2588326 RepID=A0AAN6PEK4_9PEZI|nr:hypothetical protein C8A01DRAFT_36521 [Parachaetomium inaequale]
MPMQVNYNQDCDANFRRVYGAAFAAWAATAGNNTHHGQTFDQAEVLNGMHPTTSTADPNPAHHVTVRLTNPTLRAAHQWYVLHWRPTAGESVVLPRPDNQASNDKRRADRRAKKLRQREAARKKKEEDDKKKRGGGGGAAGAATTAKKAIKK